MATVRMGRGQVRMDGLGKERRSQPRDQERRRGEGGWDSPPAWNDVKWRGCETIVFIASERKGWTCVVLKGST